MIKLLSVSVGCILVVSILIGRDATTILAGLGASAAVLMLIFRDSILGLVAGVQLSANDMLRPGDWITMAKYGADGYVTEVSLTTVKVQNFDKTITTIPPYALVSDSPSRTGAACAMRRTAYQTFRPARRLHGAVLHAGRDGTAPQRRTGTEGRFVGKRCEYADFPQLHATLPEVEPRHPPRSAPDGADPATHLRRHPSRDLLLHQSDRLDSLRNLPKRAFRPHHRHPAPVPLRIYQRPAGTDFRRNPTGNP